MSGLLPGGRAELIYGRICDRMAAICKAVPPNTPGPCYWLHSDSTESYCREHAIEAREREFGFGPLLSDRPFYLRTELEDEFFIGIGATESGESDSTEACAVCGKTLSYCLTDYGLRNEIDYYREAPLSALDGEATYALDRVAICVWPGADREALLGVAVAVNQAWRLLHANIDQIHNEGAGAANNRSGDIQR